jgi:hypothetical protein
MAHGSSVRVLGRVVLIIESSLCATKIALRLAIGALIEIASGQHYGVVRSTNSVCLLNASVKENSRCARVLYLARAGLTR